MTVRLGFVIISIALLLLVALWGAYWPPAVWLWVPVLALVALGIHDLIQRRHTILASAFVHSHMQHHH
jgi:hypothetical protein